MSCEAKVVYAIKKDRIRPQWTEAAALAILDGRGVGWGEISKYCTTLFPVPSKKDIKSACHKAWKLIRSGKIHWQYGAWNNDFVQGVIASGSVKSFHPRWMVSPSIPWLVDDLFSLPIHIKKMSLFGKTQYDWMSIKTWLFGLGGVDPNSPSRMAGLFAAARRYTDKNKKTWLVLSKTPAAKALLDEWTIPMEERKVPPNHHPFYLVSPFYGALFSAWMPMESAMTLLAIKKPANAQDLATVYWELLFSKEKSTAFWSWSLPWGVSEPTFYRRCYKRRDLHMKGLELGINRLDGKLISVMKLWKESWEKMLTLKMEHDTVSS